MITTAIIYILVGALTLILSPLLLLSDASLPTEISSALTSAGSYLHILDVAFPVYSIIAILAIYLAIEGSIFAYKMIRWAYSKIPGIS